MASSAAASRASATGSEPRNSRRPDCWSTVDAVRGHGELCSDVKDADAEHVDHEGVDGRERSQELPEAGTQGSRGEACCHTKLSSFEDAKVS